MPFSCMRQAHDMIQEVFLLNFLLNYIISAKGCLRAVCFLGPFLKFSPILQHREWNQKILIVEKKL